MKILECVEIPLWHNVSLGKNVECSGERGRTNESRSIALFQNGTKSNEERYWGGLQMCFSVSLEILECVDPNTLKAKQERIPPWILSQTILLGWLGAPFLHCVYQDRLREEHFPARKEFVVFNVSTCLEEKWEVLWFTRSISLQKQSLTPYLSSNWTLKIALFHYTPKVSIFLQCSK